eukprot:scaffold4216_cov145-Isochrysis_galbana.AAC.3
MFQALSTADCYRQTTEKKIFRRKRYPLAASRRDTLCPLAVRTLPFPSPILSPSLFPYSGRCVRGMASELRALRTTTAWARVLSLGISVVLDPMPASISTSLRADYG